MSKILNLLADKHSKDVFVSECKDGPTHSRNHLRMDAWVMNRSWAHPKVTAYEIKQTRRDFLGDDKWTGYLDLCNCFAFVCPAGVIQPEELQPGVGLLYMSKTGTRLYTKRKPAYRNVEIPEDVFRYILMARARVVPPNFYEERPSGQAAFWRRWLKEKKDNQELGYEVRGRIREIASRMEVENIRLKAQVVSYDRFRAKLAELGIDPDAPVGDWTQKQTIERLFGEHAPQLVKDARELEHRIQRFRDALEGEIRP